MGQRFVPITITVSGAQQGAQQVSGLSNAFTQLDRSANTAGTGGMTNALNATGLIRSEFQALASQIPIVGRFFNGATQDLLRYAGASQQVTQQMKLQKSAYTEFVNLVARVSGGPKGGIIPVNLIGDLEVTAGTLSTETKKRAAFAQYLKDFQAIEDPAKRAQIAIDQFGTKGAQLIPVLENMSAAEAATAGQTAAVGTSFMAIAGPAAIALAAILLLVAGFGLAAKGAFDLTKLAADTGGEVYDLGQKINFTAETISVLSVAGKTAGVDFGSLSGALGIFDKNITLAKESDTKLAKQFRDSNVDIRDNETALRSIFRALAALPPGEKQVELAMLAFGRSGKEVLGIVKETNGDLDLAIAKYQRMGLIISTDAAKAADEFGDQLDILGLQLKMVAVQIGFQLMPSVLQLLKGFSDLATKYGPNVVRNTSEIVDNFGHLFHALKDAAQGAEEYKAANVAMNVTGTSSVGVLKTMADGFLYVLNPALGETKSWLNDIANNLIEIDKRKNVPKDIAGVTPQGGRNLQSDIDKGYKGLSPDASRGAATYGKFGAEQQEKFDKELAPFKSMFEGINSQLETFGEKSHLARVEQQKMKLDLKELSPQVRDAANAYIKNAEAQARQLDAMEAAKKAQDLTRKAFEQQQTVVDRYRDGIDQLKEKIDNYNVSTHEQAEQLAFTKIKTEQMTLAQKVLIEQSHAFRLVEAKTLDAMDAAKRSKEETIKADEFLRRQIDLNKEAQEQLNGVNANGLTAADALRKSIKQYGADIANATPGLIDAAKAEAARTTAIQQRQRALDSAGAAVARAVEEFARSPLGQAREENNALLREQRDLTDPILQQQILENELLKNRIDLQRRDRDAVIATDKAQRELADATVYHATQANAQVLEFLARTHSVTEIVASAKIGVVQSTFDLIDRGLDRATHKMGIFGDVVKQVIGDFIKLKLVAPFERLLGISPQGSGAGSQRGGFGGLFGGGPGGTPTFAGGAANVGGGGSLGQSLSQRFLNFFRGGGGGTAQYASTAPFLGSLSTLSGGEGITAPTSTLSSPHIGPAIDAAGSMSDAGHAGASMATGAFGSGSFKTSIGAMLPMLGLSLGVSAGGQSRFGQIVGGAGGLLAGGIGAAFLTPGLFAASGMFGSMGPAIAALLTNPFTAIAAGALIVGAILLARNAARRKNETARAALNNDTYSAIIQVLNNARSGQYGSAGAAIADFDKIKSDYFSKISHYDSKTKRIATDVWNDTKNGFEVYRPMIKQAAEAAEVARSRSSKLVPEFRDAGAVWPQIQAMQHLRFADSGFTGRVPGIYDRQDDKLIRVSGDEVVLAPKHWKPITKYLQAVRVPGFADSGAVSRSGAPPVSDGGGDIVFHASSDAHAALLEAVLEGMTSPDGKKIIIKTTASDRARRRSQF